MPVRGRDLASACPDVDPVTARLVADECVAAHDVAERTIQLAPDVPSASADARDAFATNSIASLAITGV
jgi:hypothetical protein